MKMLVILQLTQSGKGKHKKKKKIPGMDSSSSSSNEDESGGDDGFGKLPGAKGAVAGERLRRAMRKHPEEFTRRIEDNMADALNETAVTDKSALKYIAEAVPIGNQRILGYVVTSLAHIHAALHKGEVDRARLLVLTTIMACEQASLDGNWKTAWKLMGLEPPPWADWAGQDEAAIKREYAKSRLADSRSVAAVVADMTDENFLMKRRTAPKGGGKGQDKVPAEGQDG